MTHETEEAPHSAAALGQGIPIEAYKELEVMRVGGRHDRTLIWSLVLVLLIAVLVQSWTLFHLVDQGNHLVTSNDKLSKAVEDSNTRNTNTAQFEELVRELIVAGGGSPNITPEQQAIIDQLKALQLENQGGGTSNNSSSSSGGGGQGAPGPQGPPGQPGEPAPTTTTQPQGPVGPTVSSICSLTELC